MPVESHDLHKQRDDLSSALSNQLPGPNGIELDNPSFAAPNTTYTYADQSLLIIRTGLQVYGFQTISSRSCRENQGPRSTDFRECRT